MKFDVFLSHNSQDKPDVKTLGTALKQRGLSVWLDEWELQPGLTWQNGLENIISSCGAATVCFGRSGIGPWEVPEMEALLIRFIKERKTGTIVPIIPVLLPGAPLEVKLPVFLEAFTWVDLRRGLTAEGLERLQWGITGKKPWEKKASVCLAKVTPDLRKARETVANYLTSAQLNVLPTKPYSTDATRFLPALEAHLDQADVFVQILGEAYADRTDELPEGEEVAQLRLAQQRGKKVLQWRHQSVDVDAIEDPSHRELVGGANVICNDLVEFAKLVAEQTQRLHEVRAPTNTNDSQWLALIKADKPDKAVADEVSNALLSANVSCRISRSGKAVMDWLREVPYDAVLIVCGNCSDSWLEQLGDELMAVDLNLKDLAPIRAYYISTDDAQLFYRSRGVLQLKHRDQESWQRLMTAIQQRGRKT